MDLLVGRALAVVLFLLAAGSSSCLDAAAATATVDGITAINNFGDSISDTGNLIRESPAGLLQYIAKLPYGMDMHGPTGRCSDGYLMIDFLAKDLGLPLLNPYLDRSADFTHGVNFAVAGAAALNTAALAKKGITIALTNSSLDVQLKWFKDFMASTTNSPQEIREKLASSLVMLGEIGGNDYNYAFLQTWPTAGGYGLDSITRMVKSTELGTELVPEVVQAISNAAKELLDMGVVRMVIPGNFPVGCIPTYLATVNVTDPLAYDADGCLAALNAFAELQNAALLDAVADLRAAYPGATIAYADYFAAYLRILREARALGFDAARTRAACCGAGGGDYNFEVGAMCGAPGAGACADPGAYVSWDGVHMTQHAYGVMTDMLYRGGLADPAPVKWPARETESLVH